MTSINHFLHKNCVYGAGVEHEFGLSKHTRNKHTDYRLTISSSGGRYFVMTFFMDPDVRQDLLEILSREPEEIIE